LISCTQAEIYLQLLPHEILRRELEQGISVMDCNIMSYCHDFILVSAEGKKNGDIHIARFKFFCSTSVEQGSYILIAILENSGGSTFRSFSETKGFLVPLKLGIIKVQDHLLDHKFA